jgi:hypothetical protein
VVAFVHVHGLDGVEVDFEAFGAGSADDLVARTFYSALLVKIKRALAASRHLQQQHTRPRTATSWAYASPRMTETRSSSSKPALQ